MTPDEDVFDFRERHDSGNVLLVSWLQPKAHGSDLMCHATVPRLCGGRCGKVPHGGDSPMDQGGFGQCRSDSTWLTEQRSKVSISLVKKFNLIGSRNPAPGLYGNTVPDSDRRNDPSLPVQPGFNAQLLRLRALWNPPEVAEDGIAQLAKGSPYLLSLSDVEFAKEYTVPLSHSFPGPALPRGQLVEVLLRAEFGD
ncbi:hypothetical protein BDM02DRAFT_3128957 [Thelephora ganbajun]|uniref:Uncharacterized protein n=1 Tax=Thelephora ganbajun TaxID=370292 RepID=A0ACB6ZFS7_THEGA|nr:hypothetical protein BDM02DRAFT_3128957 [Thelephora ganbajun]